MKLVRVLLLAVPVLAFAAAGDSADARIGWLGVHTDDLTHPLLVALGIDHGVVVTDVAGESPAARAGLEVGDVILSLDGEDIKDGSALRWVVGDRPEKKVEMTVRRRGKDRKLDVTLGIRERAEHTFNFEWPAIPREAFREARRALREIGPDLKKELERSDGALDSLRQQMGQLRRELDELRKKLTEKQKSE